MDVLTVARYSCAAHRGWRVRGRIRVDLQASLQQQLHLYAGTQPFTFCAGICQNCHLRHNKMPATQNLSIRCLL